MPDSPQQRLGSFHLEDLAIIALGTSANAVHLPLHPELDDERRARLRSRLKQIGRHDWPSSMRDDPLLRRGYTLRQCCRLIAALMLIDAHLAPSEAIALAKANEVAILRSITPRLMAGERSTAGPDDLLLVVPLGELVGLVADRVWSDARPQALRLVRRGDLPSLWSSDAELAFPGQRLVLDMGMAVAAAWQWLIQRNLMTQKALNELLAEIDASRDKPGFSGKTPPIQRQR